MIDDLMELERVAFWGRKKCLFVWLVARLFWALLDGVENGMGFG